MKAAKLISLAVGSLGATAGGAYGISSLVTLVNTHLEDKKVSWETVSIFGDGRKECSISGELVGNKNSDNKTSEKQLLSPTEAKPTPTKDKQKQLTTEEKENFKNSCVTYWSRSIYRRDKKKENEKKAELWIRGLNEDEVNKVLKNQPLGEVIGMESFEPGDSPAKVENLKNLCSVSTQRGWTVLSCPK